MNLSSPSFAKVNWCLKVQGKRGDGFHEILTLLQSIDLSDRLRFESRSDSRIRLSLEGAPVAEGEDNLAVRAARLLQMKTGCDKGARIHLDKRIPVGAGLGGGSSNAAVSLMALNALWQLGLGYTELAEIASELGSDVPFFLVGGLALGWGRGERILRLPPLKFAPDLLLIYPRFEVAAGFVYSRLKVGRSSRLTAGEAETRIQPFQTAVANGKWEALENDLEGAVLQEFPVLAALQMELRDVGCRKVMLCGSGSTFLVLGGPESLEEAKMRCARKNLGKAIICSAISETQYARRLKAAGLPMPEM